MVKMKSGDVKMKSAQNEKWSKLKEVRMKSGQNEKWPKKSVDKWSK